MRWEWLFSDLEAQVEAGERASFEAEVVDLVRAERGALALRDRLHAHVGCDVALHLVDGRVVAGGVLEVGADWVLVRATPQDVLVPERAIEGVAGLSRSALGTDARPRRGLRLTAVLRGLAGDRAPVTIDLLSGAALTGTVDRVGSDHVDLAVHALDEPRRPESVTGVRTLVTTAILRITVP